MNYLHACYHPDTCHKLFIFGENPEYTSPKRRGRRSHNAVTQHPSCLPIEFLSKLLLEYDSDITSNAETLTLNLPVLNNCPV
ncbi:hypothetical protein [uncultured Methanospirillum sp.]|uniref:hypothetical protein n=1 Tax=uncultured Methanospirillum sp. TaxID=262503 RepID=UPI0029C6C26C|nr:hypothetical protein [uncultured Methanospirillum sp.]